MTPLPALVRDLPQLSRNDAFRSLKTCKICNGTGVPFDRVDFNKFCSQVDFYEYGISGVPVNYYRCLSCGFIFTTDFDDWSNEQFSSFIYNEDYIKVDSEYLKVRPEKYGVDFAKRFAGCEKARLLDYGSGAGVFVETMKKRGFCNIESYDPFSRPHPPEGKFDIITCFEVIEHSTDPTATLAHMKSFLREDGCIIFSQTLQPADILSIRGSWWYLGPRNGHISLYTEEALVELARRQSMVFYRGASIYGFAPRRPSSFAAHALACAGTSMLTLRLVAPDEAGTTGIAFPSSHDVVWHPTSDNGVWQFRWTGAKMMAWEARWSAVSVLQVRVSLIEEIQSGYALRCAIELDGESRPVRMDRGEIVAEFDVRGRTSGQVTLHAPEPIATLSDDGTLNDRKRGLSIRTAQMSASFTLGT